MKKILSVLFLALVSMVGAFGSSYCKAFWILDEIDSQDIYQKVGIAEKAVDALVQDVLSDDLFLELEKWKGKDDVAADPSPWDALKDDDVGEIDSSGIELFESIRGNIEDVLTEGGAYFAIKEDQNLKKAILVIQKILQKIKKSGCTKEDACKGLSHWGAYCNRFYVKFNFSSYIILNGKSPAGSDEIALYSAAYENDPNFFKRLLTFPCKDCLGSSMIEKTTQSLQSIVEDLTNFLASSLILWRQRNPNSNLRD